MNAFTFIFLMTLTSATARVAHLVAIVRAIRAEWVAS